MRYPKVHITEQKLRDILFSAGVVIVAETEQDFICYCCFHHNVDSPAFNIEKQAPYRWKCWNGKCNQKGNIFTLLTKKGYSANEAKKMVMSGVIEPSDLTKLIEDILGGEEAPVNSWAGEDPKRFIEADIAAGNPAREYALSRGITDEAFDYFSMGYSAKKNMLVIPAFSETNEFLGVIGRAIEHKQYQYSKNLRRGSTVWNANNVIASGEKTIILTEGALDSVYLWQAGLKNVGAVLGSAISDNQWNLLHENFYEIVCFFDNDDAGWGLTESIIKNVKDLVVYVTEYPRDEKDPGGLTAQEIQGMIANKKCSIEILIGD